MSDVDLGAAAHQLLQEQIPEWPMLRGGYESLNSIHTRDIQFDGFTITLQFNPGRIVSSTAKTDAASLARRKCFLCAENRPPEQRGIPFGDDWLILCNPFPIFPEHFTVAHVGHAPQRIDENFPVLLQLAAALGSRYVVLYNGPCSGASAPDHMHFQAGSRDFMPIDAEFDRIRRLVHRAGNLEVFQSENYLRGFIALESDDPGVIARAFDAYYRTANGGDEPMMNVIASYRAGRWRAMIFPRVAHRPSFYFADDDAKILLSPAAVEMGGVCTLPIKHDFDRLTREHVEQMYREVCVRQDRLVESCQRLAQIV